MLSQAASKRDAAGIARARFGLALRERIERVPAAGKVRSLASAKSLNVAQNFGFANELARFRHQEQEQAIVSAGQFLPGFIEICKTEILCQDYLAASPQHFGQQLPPVACALQPPIHPATEHPWTSIFPS